MSKGILGYGAHIFRCVACSARRSSPPTSGSTAAEARQGRTRHGELGRGSGHHGGGRRAIVSAISASAIYRGLHLASTSLPFADRPNAGIVANALNLPKASPATIIRQRSGLDFPRSPMRSALNGQGRDPGCGPPRSGARKPQVRLSYRPATALPLLWSAKAN